MIAAAFKLMEFLTRWLHRQQMIDQITAQVSLAALTEAMEIVRTANRARDIQRDADDRDPDRMRNDVDPNRRD
jgi:hypothetical protein